MNDLLLKGPDLLKTLLGVLMRFKQFAYAISADIKDMFIKINIIIRKIATHKDFCGEDATDKLIQKSAE